MFGETWKWAGDFRLTEKTIGIAPHEISVALHNLLEDVKTQLQCKAYPLDEIAARLHHRMVYIHPFPNGNGRHSRLMADLLLVARGAARFTWGGKNIATAGDARKQYIFALQAADDKDNGPLLAFVRS